MDEIKRIYSLLSCSQGLKLKDIAAEYQDIGLILIQRSFVINMKYVESYDSVWKPKDSAFLYMTPPEIEQGEFSQKMIIAAPTEWQEAERWAGTTIGHRSEDYKAWKQTKAEALLAKMEEMFPHFKDCIEAVNTASPLTIRDYYGVKEGAMFGYAKDYKNMALSQVPVATKITNLLLTGQCVNLHGFCGVPLTAINTCEAILGQNVIGQEQSRVVGDATETGFEDGRELTQ